MTPAVAVPVFLLVVGAGVQAAVRAGAAPPGTRAMLFGKWSGIREDTP